MRGGIAAGWPLFKIASALGSRPLPRLHLHAHAHCRLQQRPPMNTDRWRALAWKSYAVLLVALVLLPLPFTAMTRGAWAGAVIGLVLCLPLIAFAWRKSFAPAWLGKFGFVVMLLVIGVSVYSGLRMHGVAGAFGSAAVIIVLLPYLVATFRHGFGRNTGAQPLQSAQTAHSAQ